MSGKCYQRKLDHGEYGRARQAGARAFRRGKHLHECPYQGSGRNTRLSMAWRDGWQDEKNSQAADAEHA